jgi:plasmid stabilization system protein ParE
MANYKIKWDKLAENDLDEIAWYLADVALVPAVAAKLEVAIRKEINSLKYSPYRRVVDENTKYRKTFAWKYIIIFSIDEDKKIVRIHRIFHGHQDWQKQLR